MKKINLNQKFGLFSDHWSPRIIAKLNGQHVKIAKLVGEFEWHQHADEDELFLVINGVLRVHFREQTVELTAGEMLVIPRGIEHRPEALGEVELLLFEPAGTLNTGENESERTVEKPEWI